MRYSATVKLEQGEYQVLIVAEGEALVSSKSVPNGWRSIKGGRCECDGFLHRQTCSHVEAVRTVGQARMKELTEEESRLTYEGREVQAKLDALRSMVASSREQQKDLKTVLALIDQMSPRKAS